MHHHNSINTTLILALTTLTSRLLSHHISWEEAPDHFDALLSEYPDQKELLQLAFQATEIMDSMPGGFLLYKDDARQTILYANQNLVRLFECETFEQLKKLTNSSFLHFMIPEEQEMVMQTIAGQIAIHPDSLDQLEYQIETRHGRRLWVEDHGHRIAPENGDPFFYVFITDITSRVQERTERDLHVENIENQIRSYKRFQNMHSEVIESLSDHDDTVLYAGLEDHFIYSFRISGPISRIVPEGSVLDYRHLFDTYLEQYVVREDQALLRIHTDPQLIRSQLKAGQAVILHYREIENGTQRHMEMRVASAGKDDKDLDRIIIRFHSIEAQIESEHQQKEELAQALETTRRATRAKDTFLANVSHDMRTPMNGILGSILLGRRKLADPQSTQNTYDDIERSARQLMAQINKLLETSALQSAPIMACETHSLCEVTDKLVPEMQAIAREAGIHFSITQDAIIHDQASFDAGKLTRILEYVLMNALTYTPQNGSVSLSICETDFAQDQATYEFRIEDTGIGMNKEQLDHIFEPFDRVSNTTESKVQGIGLGLTIVSRLVELMNGTIDMKSQPGKGTCVSITLTFPVVASEETANVKGQPAEPLHVLVVEDNELNREIAMELLEDIGFRTSEAVDGNIAIHMLKTDPEAYDIVLTDIQMPNMNGWELARAIRSHPRLASIPIVSISANSFESDIQNSMQAGIDYHIGKPIDPDMLENTLYKAYEKNK